ncbi:putative phosphatidyl-N-methylethanolamine N-methyltransferase [Papiliotrema laurentii]|uniref:Phosphatidyl-N-methylethanolamine N-methyltransferase n=1 Tax=Papiliotrema laurentii TaxID=5418 RepID=A0AAD9L7B4_PAPLA|nr:putative phosphatidyl-N-methylethanolamine N-methyltransferase [Papiliotrema laurentii]
MSKFLPADNLPSWLPIHDFADPVYNYKTGAELLDTTKTSLWTFVAMTAFNPIFWNIVARNEYRNKTITKIVGSPKVGCYLLAVTIFSLSAFRDHLYLDAVKDQPAAAELDNPLVKLLAAVLFASGQIFVISSMWALGVTGTYLGDYFGILMSHRVTGFPFNVLNDPMYIGSFLTHVGTALWFQSPAGLALAGWVLVVYLVALRFEGPFTDMIYSAAHKKNTPAPSNPARSVPTTPSRKSGRIAAKSEGPSDGEPASYAAAAAEAPGKENVVVPAQTPRRSGRVSAVARGETGSASPMRMTRSKSKSRGLGSDDE